MVPGNSFHLFDEFCLVVGVMVRYIKYFFLVRTFMIFTALYISTCIVMVDFFKAIYQFIKGINKYILKGTIAYAHKREVWLRTGKTVMF